MKNYFATKFNYACHDVLTDKVYDLLRLGLNDAIKPWNESKATEFEKYTKSQKRVSNKAKRTTRKSVSENTEPAINNTPPTVESSVLLNENDEVKKVS